MHNLRGGRGRGLVKRLVLDLHVLAVGGVPARKNAVAEG
jgi:hypothetical protein